MAAELILLGDGWTVTDDGAARLGGYVICLLEDGDMEARAAAYNRWYAKANPAPLAADGLSYHRRYLARRRRR